MTAIVKQTANAASPLCFWQAVTMHFLTEEIPIHINGKCHTISGSQLCYQRKIDYRPYTQYSAHQNL